jgi:acyl-CoA thioesterase-2
VPIPPDVPSPDPLPSQQQVIAQYGDKVPKAFSALLGTRASDRDEAIDAGALYQPRKLAPRQNVWIRTTGPVPNDHATQCAVLAYMSDMTLLDTSTFAHGRAIFDGDIQAASLDHMVPPSASAGRLAAVHAGQSLFVRRKRLYAGRTLQ